MKESGVRMKTTIVAIMILGLQQAVPARAQLADDEEEFRQMAAALRADDAERRSAISTCIEQGTGSNPSPAGMAQFMGVPLEKAWETWCTRMTNGIADGRLTLADVGGLNEGTVTPAAHEVLTSPSEGR